MNCLACTIRKVMDIERGVGVLKEMLKKKGAKKGRELEKLVFHLNLML